MNKLIIDLLGPYTNDSKYEESENVTAIHIYRWNNIPFIKAKIYEELIELVNDNHIYCELNPPLMTMGRNNKPGRLTPRGGHFMIYIAVTPIQDAINKLNEILTDYKIRIEGTYFTIVDLDDNIVASTNQMSKLEEYIVELVS